MRSLSFPALFGGLALLAGCAGPAKAPQADRAEPATLAAVQALFEERCLLCHEPPESAAKLDLSPGVWIDLAARQVDMQLVEPGKPEASYLWRKVKGTHRKGKQMPRGKDAVPLDADELAILESWIAAGAHP